MRATARFAALPTSVVFGSREIVFHVDVAFEYVKKIEIRRVDRDRLRRVAPPGIVVVVAGAVDGRATHSTPYQTK